MTFAELKEAVRKLPCSITSDAVEYYMEIVFSKNEFEALNVVLESYFGAPAKQAGQPVTDEIDRITGRYGGVSVDQIAYAKKTEAGFDVALLWPWGNKTSTTLKLIHAQ